AHTNYLVNFLKSVGPLPDQGRVFYSEPRACQPFIFSGFRSFSKPPKLPGYLIKVARILQR
ncbi:MAG: hypothetical protein MI794_10695, partial [Pseudomonadales bacterium]|nr:hypothetical protein [Pseudomonadales bacterium]